MKSNPKQIPLIDVPEVRASDLATDEDRQERYRLRAANKAADEALHLRWQKHNAGNMNRRECPCRVCKKARRKRT